MRVLLVEDDESIAYALSATLSEQHYLVDVATDGLTGWEYAEAFAYDLILLDVVLPKMDGITLCRQLRSQHRTTPILLLTSRDSRASKVEGLDAGADDYVVKPFDFEELSARIRALLRRGGKGSSPVLEWGKLQLNPTTCEVSYGGQTLSLTPKEYGLLELFLRNNQRVFSRRAILDHLWSFEEPPGEDTVRAHIKGLRSKLRAADAPVDLIETVYGLGYRLKPEKGLEGSQKSVEETAIARGSEVRTPLDKSPNSLSHKGEEKEKASPLSPSTGVTKRAALNEAVAKVWERFKDSISDRVSVLELATSALLEGELTEELRQKAGREAHKLAGSLGTFGFAEGSQLAREMENLLQTIPTPHQVPRISQLAILLRQVLQQGYSQLNGGDREQESETSSTAPPPLATPLRPLCPTTSKTNQLFENGDRPFLLIIDRDRTLTDELVSEALRQGLCAAVTTDLSTARNAFRQPSSNNKYPGPDAVLLDLSLEQTPEEADDLPSSSAPTVKNSYQLLAELASQTPPIPVLAIAAKSDFADRLEVARLGGRAFLQKPIAPTQIIDAVLDVLRLSRTNAEAKVMVVDDDPHMLEALRLLLEPWGVKTLTLCDPRQFWETLEVSSPDLLVLDVEMPGITGIELCLTVRSDPRWAEIPILFLTAHTDSATVHQVFAVGADDYVSKPVVGPELVTRILNRLERSQLLRSRAETDPLTGVANRRHSAQDLNQFLQLARRHGEPICFVLLDLDRFKQVNDEYGHAMGDAVLRRLGELLLRNFRSQDIVARWGGEEFVIGMYGMTKQDGVKRLQEMLLSWRTEEFADESGRKFSISCSAGVAEYPIDGMDLQTLYRMADRALYRAKAEGRDRVVVVDPEQDLIAASSDPPTS